MTRKKFMQDHDACALWEGHIGYMSEGMRCVKNIHFTRGQEVEVIELIDTAWNSVSVVKTEEGTVNVPSAVLVDLDMKFQEPVKRNWALLITVIVGIGLLMFFLFNGKKAKAA